MGVLGGITEGGGGSGGDVSGEVIGPGISTDKAIPSFSGTDGEQILDNPNVTIPADGVLQVATVRGSASSGGSLTVQSTAHATKGPIAMSANQVTFPAGTASVPGIAVTGDATTGVYARGASRLTFTIGGSPTFEFSASKVIINTGMGFCIANTTVDATDADVTLWRFGPKTWAFGDLPGNTNGYFMWGGESYLAADFTNATDVMAATGLSVPVMNGRRYTFRAVLKATNSTPADGIKFDFDGGTATATNFWSVISINDVGSSSYLGGVTTLSEDVVLGSFDGSAGNGWVEVSGSFEPATAGTFAIRAAEVAHTTGTLTIQRGSFLMVHELP